MWLALVLTRAAADGGVIQLTDKSFEKLVQGRARSEIWLVMFSDAASACQDAMPAFRNASDVASDMIKFGVLDIARYPGLREANGVTATPSFRIFHADGDTAYKGPSRVRMFVQRSMAFLRDVSEVVEPSWRDEMLARPSAVLFSEKSRVPAVWVGVSSFFRRTSLRIGLSNDSAVAAHFGVGERPAIVFMNGTSRLTYGGGRSFRDVRTAIEAFFARRLGGAARADDSSSALLTPDEFAARCYGGKDLCVIAVCAKAPGAVVRLQKELARHRIAWFTGKLGLPDPFMEVGGVWVYNPRRDGFLHVEDPEALADAMERVLDGTARWVKRVDLSAPADL